MTFTMLGTPINFPLRTLKPYIFPKLGIQISQENNRIQQEIRLIHHYFESIRPWNFSLCFQSLVIRHELYLRSAWSIL